MNDFSSLPEGTQITITIVIVCGLVLLGFYLAVFTTFWDNMFKKK